MTAEEAAIEALIEEVVRRKDGETTRYIAEKARAVAHAARVEALRGAAEAWRALQPNMRLAHAATPGNQGIGHWLAARAEEEERG